MLDDARDLALFAAGLAGLADIYVNDAFGAAHGAHATTEGVAHLLPSYAGLLLERELSELTALRDEPERPLVVVLGGSKVSDKIEVLEALLGRVDAIAIGGAMANTFLKARGLELGASLVEEDKLPVARNFLRKASEAKVQVRLPVVVIGGGLARRSAR